MTCGVVIALVILPASASAQSASNLWCKRDSACTSFMTGEVGMFWALAASSQVFPDSPDDVQGIQRQLTWEVSALRKVDPRTAMGVTTQAGFGPGVRFALKPRLRRALNDKLWIDASAGFLAARLRSWKTVRRFQTSDTVGRAILGAIGATADLRLGTRQVGVTLRYDQLQNEHWSAARGLSIGVGATNRDLMLLTAGAGLLGGLVYAVGGGFGN